MVSKELRIEINTVIKADDATRLSELLKQHNLGVNDKILRHDKTVLMHSAEHGATNCMNLLLAHPDINVNAVDDDIFSTALMYAVRHEQTECVRLLLARTDIDVNKITDDGGNVMDSATACKNAECLKLLLSHEGLDIGNNGRTSIVHSAYNRNPELVKLLLQLGFDIDSVGDRSSTALMLSSRGNNHELVKILLDNGADTNLTDSYGNTALKLAMQHVDLPHDFAAGGDTWHESESMRLLVSHGAELPDAVTVNNLTTTPQTRLQTFTTLQMLTSLILQADTALTPEVKTLAEKITIHDLFSPNVAPVTLNDSPAVWEACMIQAKTTAQTICDRVANYDASTQEFILNNAHFIDLSLDGNFKSWKVANVGVKTTLVNLAYACGGPVKHIESLIGFKPQKIEKFMKLIPIDEAGNILEYSVGEFKLSAVSKHPLEALGQAIDDSNVGDIATTLILSFLSTDDVVSAPETPLAPDMTLIGDGLTYGPAEEA